jgi:MFS transporter, DHA1 family, multidrug resistance protein
MLFQEPIVSPHHVEFPQNTPKTDMRKLLAMTLYSNLVYSILYLIIFAYPYSFQVVRGWKSHSYFLLDYSGLPGQVIQTSPVPQALSGIFIGCGIFLVFLPSQIYIVDTYLMPIVR